MKAKIAVITAVVAMAAAGVVSHHGKGNCPLKNVIHHVNR